MEVKRTVLHKSKSFIQSKPMKKTILMRRKTQLCPPITEKLGILISPFDLNLIRNGLAIISLRVLKIAVHAHIVNEKHLQELSR